MTLETLDSRRDFGTDIERLEYPPWPEELEPSGVLKPYPCVRQIRVIVGYLPPNIVRLSAPEIDVVADGSDFEQAWADFVNAVRDRQDSPWLAFDVGPTRAEEVAEGLNAPEDEDWAEPVEGIEG